MANITGNWNKDAPSGSSLVAHGDDLLRQHQGSLEDTLNEEHYFANSPTEAGIHQPGASRISYGNLTSLKTTATEGRQYYAVDDQSMYLTGPSATTKVAGSQTGGPVRSAKSGTYGWYISSYRTDHKGHPSKYSFLNSFGNPTLQYVEAPSLLGAQMQVGTSSSTTVGLFMVHSVTSSYVEGTFARYSRELDTAGQAADTFSGVASSLSGVVHISVMGLISVSEYS